MTILSGLSDAMAVQFGVSDDAENPLEVIGFDEKILDLGLTEDELWDYVQKTSRWLIVNIHPDVTKEVGQTLAEKHERIKQAYDTLKDKRKFRLALSKFRRKKSEQKSEQNELQRTLSASQANVNRLREELTRTQSYSNRMKQLLTMTQDRLTERIETEGLFFHKPVVYRHRVPGQGRYYAVGREQATSLIVMSVSVLGATRGPANQKLGEYKAEYNRKVREIEFQRKKKMQSTELLIPLRDDMLANGFGGIQFRDLISQARNTNDLLRPVVWNQSLAFRKLGFIKLATMERKKTVKDPLTDLSYLSVEGLNGLDASYRKALTLVEEMLIKRKVSLVNEVDIRVQRIPLERGYFKYGRMLHRIIGSVFPHDLLAATGYHISAGQIRVYDKVVTSLARPLILLNSMVVSTPVETIKILGSNERDVSTYLINNLQNVKRTFHATHFILDMECEGDIDEEELTDENSL